MMNAMASQTPGASIDFSAVCSGADQRKRQSSALLGPVLLLRHDAVARILANESTAFFESCVVIG